MLGFPLGILSAAGAAVVDTGAYELISSTILGTATSSITFDVSTFASTYKHLQIRMVGRTSRANNGDGFNIRFNSDTGANYALHTLRGEGSSIFSEAGANQTSIQIGYAEANNNTSGSFAACVFDVLDAFSTTKNKTARGLSGYSSSIGRILLNSGHWRNTNAITSIEVIVAIGPNFLAGSRFSLYGIKG